MRRKQFITYLGLLPFADFAMKLNAFTSLSKELQSTSSMPVLFLGHGSPMNAIEENEFVEGFRKIAAEIERPKAILCVSAHWETRGTFVTAMPQPKTIHDFGGFPQALFEVQYPAPGSPALAEELHHSSLSQHIALDHSWGLDHGAWSVLKHLYPNADVPVIQLSLDVNMSPKEHYNLAQQLATLRRKGVLVIGSGNMVHNLGKVAWNRLNDIGFAFDWAQEASSKMKSFIVNGDHQSLIDFRKQGTAFDLAIPSAEHYLPLLYVLGMQDKSDNLKLFNDKALAGALTMTSLMIGS
ncbi:MAG: 4,5-DOPA dioxygenase extradiol [Bacteroidia bacterium]|jgi:4,5-DOPA dioxygenase extradiol